MQLEQGSKKDQCSLKASEYVIRKHFNIREDSPLFQRPQDYMSKGRYF